MKRWLLGLLGLILLSNPLWADDIKWHSAAVGMPYFLVYDYALSSTSGRLENNNPDWAMYMHFPITSDYINALPTTTMPSIHINVALDGAYSCNMYANPDTGSSSYTALSLSDPTTGYEQKTWSTVPSTTIARRYITCSIPKYDGERSGVSGFRMYETGSDHSNDKKTYTGSMCRAINPNDGLRIQTPFIYNVDTISRTVFCPIVSDNTGDLDAIVYVYDTNPSVNFSCTLRDINPTSGSYYSYSGSSSGSSDQIQAIDFSSVTSHYTNGYRGISCSIPYEYNDYQSVLAGYVVNEQS